MSNHDFPESKTASPDLGDLFLQFRRKVQQSEILSAATVRLLESLHYTGRVSVVVQNGQVLKTGYEEGYFRRKDDLSF